MTDEKPDLMPDPPGGRDAGGESEGQVSQVQNMADAGEPVSDSQSVSGQPADAAGTQEGGVGPNAVPPENAERTGIDHDGTAAPEGSGADQDDAAGDRAGRPRG